MHNNAQSHSGLTNIGYFDDKTYEVLDWPPRPKPDRKYLGRYEKQDI